MNRLRLILTALTVAALFAAITTSRRIVSADSHTGSVTPAAPMLERRSGHSATLLQDGSILIAGGMRRIRTSTGRRSCMTQPLADSSQPAK